MSGLEILHTRSSTSRYVKCSQGTWGANRLEFRRTLPRSWKSCSSGYVFSPETDWSIPISDWWDWWTACTTILARKDVPHWEHPDDIALIRSTLRIDQEFNDVSCSCSWLAVRPIYNRSWRTVPRQTDCRIRRIGWWWILSLALLYDTLAGSKRLDETTPCYAYHDQWGILRELTSFKHSQPSGLLDCCLLNHNQEKGAYFTLCV